MFEDWSKSALESNVTDMANVSDGGAALTAYGKLQFENVSDQERAELEKALLNYCELDTLAMVMIYERLNELISS